MPEPDYIAALSHAPAHHTRNGDIYYDPEARIPKVFINGTWHNCIIGEDITPAMILRTKFPDPIKVGQDGHVIFLDAMGNDAAIDSAARTSYGAGTRKVSE